MKALTVVHLAANALLLWLGYYWLGVGESRTSSLLWSALLALFLATMACWVYGASFLGRSAPMATAYRTSLRHLPAILAAGLVVLLLYYLLGKWSDYSSQPAFNIASWLTLKLRRPVKPNSILAIFNVVAWIVRWVVLPVLALPWLASVSARGWAGLARRLPTTGRYWIQAPVLLILAFWLPFVLLGWVPYHGSFTVEMVSFVIRLLVAYLLFTGAWLALAFLTSAGSPVFSQLKTEAKP
ncbi:MAG TPA: hypothetical protein VKU19_19130 [Bryobacteraceae bacterium]|nr:hypothetical protein [Bryobacteraceae bacterium]